MRIHPVAAAVRQRQKKPPVAAVVRQRQKKAPAAVVRQKKLPAVVEVRRMQEKAVVRRLLFLRETMGAAAVEAAAVN